jgi:hypothetical protein
MTHSVLEIKAVATVKELAIIGKEFDIQGISKMKKEDLRAEILVQVKNALKGLPVDGPTAVLEAVEAVEELLPNYFEAKEDKSTASVPYLTRRLGEPLQKDTIVLHVDFGRAGTKKARVYVIQKCFGQHNSSHHIFDANKPEVTVAFLNLLKDQRVIEDTVEVEVEKPVKKEKPAPKEKPAALKQSQPAEVVEPETVKEPSVDEIEDSFPTGVTVIPPTSE